MSELPSTKFTLEDLREIAYRGSYDDMQRSLARALLAAYEQEPVAWRCLRNGPFAYVVTLAKSVADDWERKGWPMMPLYTHPAPSIPATVPEKVTAAILEIVRVRNDLHAFDGDKRGIAECLCEKEEALICIINEHHDEFRLPEGGVW